MLDLTPCCLLQVLAIVLGIVIFHTAVTSLSALGVFITVVGIVWYARASYMAKMAAAAKDPLVSPHPLVS
jgi:hypothetical protein